jgi:hypothetical protein
VGSVRREYPRKGGQISKRFHNAIAAFTRFHVNKPHSRTCPVCADFGEEYWLGHVLNVNTPPFQHESKLFLFSKDQGESTMYRVFTQNDGGERVLLREAEKGRAKGHRAYSTCVGSVHREKGCKPKSTYSA